ncbi:hypothetical protein F1D05_19885 [Kribbella qitaiheensis]|uniref:Uncharacterized protein n=1 Tax=Kribbella qitaiheensis TaxID=1544730 RepID=A0A7G6X0K0_9ACTN|nr:hypothetical protein [Kribbella qitaiheensis]QNE19765.1 hypothetical protein F1D05_19885 [Kribbella qitaiheensis]
MTKGSAGSIRVRLDEIGRAFDDELAACNDAADERINGPKDAADLAPLQVVARGNLSDEATGRR